MTAWAVKRKVCVLNVTHHDRLDSNASDQIARCCAGGRQVPRILVVGKVTEAGAEGSVALNGWDAYCVNFLASHCHAFDALGQEVRDDGLQELGW